MEASSDENVEIVSAKAAELVEGLKRDAGKGIWLAGGASLASALLSAGSVDELILKVNPVVLGSGIPLFSGTVAQARLELAESRIYKRGVAAIHYRISPRSTVRPMRLHPAGRESSCRRPAEDGGGS